MNPEMAHRAFPLSRSTPGWIPLDFIPQACVQAVVVAEDVTFFQHRGSEALVTWRHGGSEAWSLGAMRSHDPCALNLNPRALTPEP